MEEAHTDLLQGVPTAGRNITWEEISTAQYPMFGAAAPRADEDTAAAEVRMQAYWDDLRRAEARAERRRWRDKFGKAIIPGCTLSKESFACRALFCFT